RVERCRALRLSGVFGIPEPIARFQAKSLLRLFPGIRLPPGCHPRGLVLSPKRLRRVEIPAAKLRNGHPIALPAATALAVGAGLRTSILANLIAAGEAFVAGYSTQCLATLAWLFDFYL